MVPIGDLFTRRCNGLKQELAPLSEVFACEANPVGCAVHKIATATVAARVARGSAKNP
jgi:hypothetical protein